jgi:hypothetical protein
MNQQNTIDLKNLIHQVHDLNKHYLVELSLCNSACTDFSNFDIKLTDEQYNNILQNIRSLDMWKQHFEANNLYFYKNNLVMTVRKNGKEFCFNNVCHKTFYYSRTPGQGHGLLVRILKNNPYNSRLFPFTRDIDFMETVDEEVFQNSTATFKFEIHIYQDDMTGEEKSYKLLKVYIKNTVNTDYYLKLLEPEYNRCSLEFGVEY